MMQEDHAFRQLVHRAVEARCACAVPDALLMQRVLARAQKKEAPLMKKKLSTAAVLLIALLLLTVTALAVGLTVEEMWKQSFQKMNTVGEIRRLSDEAQAEITMDEAIAIARSAIIAKYGTPQSELDAMGVYPTYAARGWDGMTAEEPSEWDVYLSSRTDVNLDEDHVDYGPTGEYRVYINAETKEVTYCHWYTNDFWSRAQTIWDCGSHDEVYWHYGKSAFYCLPPETQDDWSAQLAAEGYAVVAPEDRLRDALRVSSTELLFQPLAALNSSDDPQIAAAWAALEAQYGFDADTLQRYGFVASRPAWQTGTDNIVLHYSYELAFDLQDAGFLSDCSSSLFEYALRFGLYAVSFEPGTTAVAAVTHIPRSEALRQEPVADGSLLARSDWTAADLPAFDAAFQRLELALRRMRAAGLDAASMESVTHSYLNTLGAAYSIPSAAPAADAWFAAESEWDALLPAAAPSYAEFTALYGSDERFWPMEVLVQLSPQTYRMPLPGETTLEDAAAIALNAIVTADGEEMRAILSEYQVFCRRVSLTDDPARVDCRWEVFLVRDPANPVDGFKVTWGEWDSHSDLPHIQSITDNGNG